MRGPRAEDVLGRVTLVTGKEEFLSERTVAAVRAAVRGFDAEAEFSETVGADLSLATLGELAAPSLFSSTRCVVVRALENLPEEAIAGLVEYAGLPAEEVALVLVHGGGQKGTGVLTKLRKLDPVTEVKTGEVKAHEMGRFVAAEVRGFGGRVDDQAADALVQSVGNDLRGLSAAAHQLVNDFPGEAITAEKVKRYFGGRAEAKSFAVADAAFYGKPERALEELRWALDGGTAAVLVTSAFASGARGLARLKANANLRGDAQLAAAVGVPPWKIKTLRGQARDWTDEGIGRAIVAIADADADIKGRAHDASYTLERLVLTITDLRDSR